MKRDQDLKGERLFFEKVIDEQGDYDTISEAVYELIFDKIQIYLNGKLLDAGCGAGAFGERLVKRNKSLRIVGADINAKALSLAKERNIYQKLVCADLGKRETFRRESFDCILAPFLVHHFPDMTQLLENLYFWLKPGGFLIIIDPNGSNLILKIIFLSRRLLSKVFDFSGFASPNKRSKSVAELKSNLNNFELVLSETFPGKPWRKTDRVLSFFRKIYVNLYQASLDFYGFLPIANRGAGILIVARK